MNIYLAIPFSDNPDGDGWCGAICAIRAENEHAAYEALRDRDNSALRTTFEIVELSTTPPVRLTDHERAVLAVAGVGASHEVQTLIGIVERLTGETVTPADER